MEFKDHFSSLAAGYRRFRPEYPDALFAYLAGLAPDCELAWDAGCGSGQAAVGLARHFRRVAACDASAQQVEKAEKHPRIEYRVAPAEDSGLPAASADLALAAQAAHWFDIEAYYHEVRRVLRPGGIIALCGYGWLQVAPAVDAILERFYAQILGPCWPPERKLLDNAYRDLPFPFRELDPPPFALHAEWTLDQLIGYLETWSAVRRYREERGEDPLQLIRCELVETWGDAEAIRKVSWPMHLRVGVQED